MSQPCWSETCEKFTKWEMDGRVELKKIQYADVFGEDFFLENVVGDHEFEFADGVRVVGEVDTSS